MLLIATDASVVTNLVYPDDLPVGCVASGASVEFLIRNFAESIERFDEVGVVITRSHNPASLNRECADATRASHSMSILIF